MGKKTYLYDSFAQIKFKSKGGKVVFKIIRRLNREQATNLRYLGETLALQSEETVLKEF